MNKELKAEVTIYLQGRDGETDDELKQRFEDVLYDALRNLVDHNFDYNIWETEIKEDAD
ncbi:Uncharacterised protein [uncultured Clostridium sp.]|nr:Uncharacterised protein [uncultured Clostridium sp.]